MLAHRSCHQGQRLAEEEQREDCRGGGAFARDTATCAMPMAHCVGGLLASRGS